MLLRISSPLCTSVSCLCNKCADLQDHLSCATSWLLQVEPQPCSLRVTLSQAPSHRKQSPSPAIGKARDQVPKVLVGSESKEGHGNPVD